MPATRAGAPRESSRMGAGMPRPPSWPWAPRITMTAPTGPPSVVGASRCGAEASVIHVSVLAAALQRLEFLCEFLYDWWHIIGRPGVVIGLPLDRRRRRASTWTVERADQVGDVKIP